MKTYPNYLILILVIISNTLFAQGFETSPNFWAVPSGGQQGGSTGDGFIAPFDFSTFGEGSGSELWSLLDIDGDNKLDLVVTAALSGGVVQTFNTGSPAWKVYFNNGTGFDTSPTFWTLPTGGQESNGSVQGFIATADYSTSGEDTGSQLWNTLDINGDNKPDLIVTSEKSGTNNMVFNNGNDVWQVHLNNGSGFDLSPSFWTVPVGGQDYNGNTDGFNATADYSTAGEDAGSQRWTTFDIDGDGLPDIVGTSERVSGNNQVFNTSNPTWQVYFNNGTGFDLSPTFWNVPTGGQITAGNTLGFNASTHSSTSGDNNNSKLWYTTDIDGDDKPDLVITSQRENGLEAVINNGNTVWQVYFNNGNGFNGSPTFWNVPPVGQKSNGNDQGLIRTVDFSTFGEDNGSLVWNFIDIDNDGLKDIVVAAEKNGSDNEVFFNNGLVWQVYLNNGSGFSLSPSFWTIPTGGHITLADNYGFNTFSDFSTVGEGLNSEMWQVMDIDGNNSLDLVVTSASIGSTNAVFENSGVPVWKVFYNTSTTTISEIKETALSVYPNPTSDKLYISSSTDLTNELFELTDLNGSLLLTDKVSAHNQVNLEGIAKGIYILKVNNAVAKIAVF